MKTVLAVIAAAALIAGALFVRSDVLDGRGLLEGGVQGPGAGSEAAADPDDDAPAEVPTVACDAALGDGCPEGAQRVDLDALLAAFAADEAAFDIVIAPSVVIEYIEQSQTSRVAFSADRRVLATSPLLLAANSGTAQTVVDACGTETTWACVADLVQDTAIVPGIRDPRRTSEGLAAFAALTGGFLGTASYSSNAFGDADFLTWLAVVQDQSMVHGAPIDALIQFNGARNDSAIVIEAGGLATIGRAAQNPPGALWPQPLASLAVVAAAVDGVDAAAITTAADAAGASLSAAGWRGPDGAPTGEGGPPPADDDGLPSGGVLFALQERWN